MGKSIEDEFLSEVVGDKIKSTRRKGINSKKKGNKGELDCTKLLNERFDGKALFHRNVMSGAYVGGQNVENTKTLTEEQMLAFAGDISCNNAKFKFTIEHKFYEKLDFYDLFNASSKLFEWYGQSETDAALVHKEPLLIVKTNNHKRIAFVNMSYMIRNPYLDNDKIVFIHKGKACMWLEDLLTAPDSFFFEE